MRKHLFTLTEFQLFFHYVSSPLEEMSRKSSIIKSKLKMNAKSNISIMPLVLIQFNSHRGFCAICNVYTMFSSVKFSSQNNSVGTLTHDELKKTNLRDIAKIH